MSHRRARRPAHTALSLTLLAAGSVAVVAASAYAVGLGDRSGTPRPPAVHDASWPVVPPPPATAHKVRADRRYRPGGGTGTAGTALAQFKQRLRALGYQATAGGGYDEETRHAVVAFQKVHALPRTGQADAATLGLLDHPVTPAPRYGGSGLHVEVDLTRQVVLVVEDGTVTKVYDACTGGPDSPTPTGSFTIQRHIDGIRHAPLGDLYRPIYFIGGYAFHGHEPVLTEPASHGCVRMTDLSIDAVFPRFTKGTRVHIYAA